MRQFLTVETVIRQALRIGTRLSLKSLMKFSIVSFVGALLWLNAACAQGLLWLPQQRIPGVGSSVGPSLAAFQNLLFAAWKGQGNDQGIYWSHFDGRSWAAQQKISGVGSSTSPALAVFQNLLFAIWKGEGNDQGLYWSHFEFSCMGDGLINGRLSWEGSLQVPGVDSSIGPALAVFNNKLFAAWKGESNDQGIYWSNYSAPPMPNPGKLVVSPCLTGMWAPQQRIANVGTSFRPSLAVFDNRLFAAWKGINNDEGIYFSSAQLN
jgi:hypothetical protein